MEYTPHELSGRKSRFQFFLGALRITLTLFLISVMVVYIAFYVHTGTTISSCWADAVQKVSECTEDDLTPNRTTYFFNDDGKKLVKLSGEGSSTWLNYDEIPEDVVNAFIAVEDRSFWTNPGYDLKGIARAACLVVKNHGVTQGGSTITQQLVRTLYLSNERTILRKVREIFISYNLTQKFSKETILMAYVNNCCFANGIYGIQDAAKTYFGKSISECSLSEIAYLCAIPNWPEHYDPYNDSEAAITRRDKILGDMLELEMISQDEYDTATSEYIEIVDNKSSYSYGYETTYAIKCAAEILMEQDGFKFKYAFDTNEEYEAYQTEYREAYNAAREKLYTGGYTIETSIDSDRQEDMQDILNNTLDKISDKKTSDGTYKLQGSITVIDNNTHKVVAVIGGRTTDNDAAYAFNRAYQSKRQPGSAIKPLIVYTPALMSGYTDTSTVKNVDVQKAYDNGGQVQSLSGEKYSLRYAVEHSLNGCALYVFDDIKPANGLKYLEKMHFTGVVPEDENLSVALGGFTYGTNTVEMAAAYSTLSNNGKYRPATCIVSMMDSDGNEIYSEPKAVQVYDTDAAVLMTNILEGVLKEGTAKSANWYSYTSETAAGKTGTTNDLTNGWFCGYTKDYTIAVWVGNDDQSEVENLYGNTYPVEIWREAMLNMLDIF